MIKSYNYYTMYEGLKPCPFCGNPVMWNHNGNDYTQKRLVVIKCRLCNVRMEIAGIRRPLAKLEDIIVNSWNNRVSN